MFNLRKHTFSLFVLLIVAALLLAACGGGEENTPTPTAVPTLAPAPTEAPTEAATEAPAATAEITGTQPMTGTAAATATAEITGTQSVTGSATATATAALTSTQPVTGSAAATATVSVSATLEVIQGRSVLASALIGARIRNLDGENIGKIEDVVVNMVGGHLLFVTMNYDGGFFQSSKTFPVPAGAFSWDAENEVLQLNVAETTLEEAPGFDSGWPDMTAEGYNAGEEDAQIYAYWQAQFPELPAPSATAPITGTVAKVSDMIGLGVRNPQGENIGEIADMIINVERQQLSAAVLAFRAFLFMGKETFVVPYAAFSLDVSSVDRRNPIGTPILNITQENLANAPPFNPKEVDLTDPNWSQPYQSWWQRMAQPPATGQGLLPLSMTAWVLESFGEPEDNLPVIPGTRPSVNFLVERYTGYGGCNWFLGVYTSGTDGSLRMQTPATSIPAVCEPAGVMVQETTFMSALLNVTEYQIEEGKLVGYTVQNQRMLTLSPAEPVPFDATLWTLRFFIQGTLGAPLIGGTAITAQFAGDQVSGSAGCNTYTATVVHDGDKLSFSDVKATEKTCSEPEGIMDQEAKFLADLASVATNVHLGGTLQMADSSGQPILLFGTDVQPSTP